MPALPVGSGRPNLILIGFMASGKSTLGRQCARQLGFAFRDTDMLVERWAGKPVQQIFADDGETCFRSLELKAVRSLCRNRSTVIATGGGAPLNSGSVAYMRRSGVVVLIKVTAEDIILRTRNRQNRPLLADAADPELHVRELLTVRDPVYRAAANVTVETSGLTHEESVAIILQAYNERARMFRTVE